MNTEEAVAVPTSQRDAMNSLDNGRPGRGVGGPERPDQMLLLPHHREHLYESALTDETIDKLRFRSETDPEEVSRILNWSTPATELGPCLVIPYLLPDGARNGYARIRPDRPRLREGKPVKYEQPRRVSPTAYFTPGAIQAIRNRDHPIGFTEGEKKAAAADQAGCPCIGLAGVWNWQRKRPRDEKGRPDGERRLNPDLAGVEWNDRRVWICFDTDETRKPSVNHARAELARILTEHGARVDFIELPI